MVAAGRAVQLSYFDHPPLSWWLSRAAALLFGTEAPWAVRAPFVALFAGSTWLMFAWTRTLFGAAAGVWAAAALNLSPVFGVTGATWVLPDGPLICALLAAAFCLTRAVAARPWLWWPLAGLCAGLALLSKYSAILILAGAVIYYLTQPAHRKWLGRPHPYVAAAVALACCAPIVLWNARHGWISFAFQGGRAGAASFHPFGPLATLAGEALFLLPWIWLPLMIAWVGALRAGPNANDTWLPACLGAIPVALFVVISFWARHVLFHWAAPGYLMLFPLLGRWLAHASPRLTRVGLRATAALVAAGVALLMIEAQVNLLSPFGIDPGFQATDWTPLRDQLDARGLLHRPNTVMAATNWQDMGKLDYGLGGAVPVVVMNPDARQYLFAPGLAAHPGEDVLILGPRLTAEGVQRTYASLFRAVRELEPATVRGAPIRMFLAR